jgi:hypothetical protein
MGPKGPGGDEISDSLRLEEVHSIIQERALRELPRVGLPGPDLKAALEQGGKHHRPPVALKLHHVLPRKGVGTGKIDHEALVEGFSGAVA